MAKKTKRLQMIVTTVIILLLFIILIPLFNIIYWRISRPSATGQIKIIGHRGAANLAPENTLAAIDSGLQYGADFIEIDIRQTRDNKIVVLHDKSVNRTTNGKGNIKDLLYAEVETLNATAHFPGNSKVTKIPLLTEVLAKIKNNTTNCKLLLDIKDPYLYPGMLTQLIDIIRNTKSEDYVLAFSFNKKCLIEIKKSLPSVKTGLFSVSFMGVEPDLQVSYVAPNWLAILYFPYYVTYLHKKGYQVLVWTIDNPFFMNYLISKGVDGIITDSPDRAPKR